MQPGARHGRLLVVDFDHADKYSRKFWLCSCACGSGKRVVADTYSLRAGTYKSCGCIQKGIETAAASPKGKDRAAMVCLIATRRKQAKARGLVYDLTLEQFTALARSPCGYCGCPAGNLFKKKATDVGIPYSGIDRVDPSRGYTPDNVVPACGVCNRFKMTLDHDGFKDHVLRMAERIAALGDKWGTAQDIGGAV